TGYAQEGRVERSKMQQKGLFGALLRKVLFSCGFTGKSFTQTLHFFEDFLKLIVYNPGCVREDRRERNQDTHVQTNFKTGSPHHDRFYHVRYVQRGGRTICGKGGG